MKYSRWTPAFMLTKCGTQCLASQIKAAPFVAEQVSPAPGATQFAGSISGVGDRSRSGDCDAAWTAGMRSGKRNDGIARDTQFFGLEELSEDRFFIVRASGETQTR